MEQILKYEQQAIQNSFENFTIMPYRRLPNTDQARVRAMVQALDAYQNNKRGSETLSNAFVYKLQLKLNEMNAALFLYNEAFETQRNNSKQLDEKFHICRLYLSHFVQVLNFCILRDELQIEDRKYYQLSDKKLNVPNLQTQSQVFAWGKKIIEGEIMRTKTGGMRIENPSIGKVKVAYDAFADLFVMHKQLLKRTKDTNKNLSVLRPSVDVLIKEVWDSVETHFSNLPSIIRREKNEAFGIKYCYRKNEEKIDLDDIIASSHISAI